MKKQRHERAHETNKPTYETNGPKITPYINEDEGNVPNADDEQLPPPSQSIPDPVEAEPAEPLFTVRFTASQIKALQDVLSGAARVPGVTGATPVHDDDAGASSVISKAVQES